MIDRFIEGTPDFVRHELELHAEETFAATITRARELMLSKERRATPAEVKPVNCVDGAVQSPVFSKDPYVAGLEKRLEQLEQQLPQTQRRLKEVRDSVLDVNSQDTCKGSV